MFRVKANTDVSLNVSSQIWNKINTNLIFSSGNVGIGTNVIYNNLQITGSCGIGTGFSTSSIQPTSLVVSGNVGIGTYYTNAKLHINGGNVVIKNTNPTLNISGLNLNLDESNVATLRNNYGDLKLSTSGGSGITLSSTGNVGMGSNMPRTLLDINGNAFMPGHVIQVQTVQTSSQNTFNAPTGNVLTVITPLDIVITPKKANSRIILQWMVNGEVYQDTLFVVMKNNTAVGFNTTAGNIYTSGTVAGQYDPNADNATTPSNFKVFWVDNNVGATTAQTYSLGIKSTQAAAAYTLYLNRTVNSAGGLGLEASISNGIAFEIAS